MHIRNGTRNTIGILTSGGDAAGMNAVIAGACQEADRAGARAVGVHHGFAGLAQQRAAVVDTREAAVHESEPGTWLGTARWPALREPAGRDACLRALEALGLGALLVIGGEGSAEGARALAGAVPVAVVPATIDGDVTGTARTVGTDSAVAYACDVIDRLRVTGRSLPGRAFVVETLGAPTGHLADAVAAAARLQAALVPERPHDLDAVAGSLAELAQAGDAVVVVSEAAADAVTVARELARRSGLRVHPTILGHAQRAATPTAADRALGLAAGRAAVSALVRGDSTFTDLRPDGTAVPIPLVQAVRASAPPAPIPKEASRAARP